MSGYAAVSIISRHVYGVNLDKIPARERWQRCERRLTLISLPLVRVKRCGKAQEAFKKDLEKRKEFEKLSTRLPRIRPQLHKDHCLGKFGSKQQLAKDGGERVRDEFACKGVRIDCSFAAAHGRFEKRRKELFELQARCIIHNRQIEMLTHRMGILKKMVATLAQLCPPEVYGPAPTSHDMQTAFTSLQVHYAEVVLQLNQPLSSSSTSFEYRTDEKQCDECRSALQWQIEREKGLIARLDIIVAKRIFLM